MLLQALYKLRMRDLVIPWNTSFMVVRLPPKLVSGIIRPLQFLALGEEVGSSYEVLNSPT